MKTTYEVVELNSAYCLPQVADAAVQLQSMLISLFRGKNMAAMGGLYLELGLRLSDRKLESHPVQLTRIGDVLCAEKVRAAFPRPLTQFFQEPDSLKYFNVSKAGEAGTAGTTVMLRIGDLVADHTGRARPSVIDKNAHCLALKGPRACRSTPLSTAKRPCKKPQSSAALDSTRQHSVALPHSGVAAASSGPSSNIGRRQEHLVREPVCDQLRDSRDEI